MAELVTVARPYAKAAFSVANTGANKQVADKKLAQWSSVLQVLANTISCQEGKTIIDNPDLPKAKAEEFLNEICEKYSGGKPLTKDIKNFIHILVENGRLALAPAIFDTFEAYKAERDETKDALITSAFPIEENQLKTLTDQLVQRFSCKINPTVKVDESLIGGVIVEIGDEVIDASIRGKLEKMAVVLKN